MIRFLLVALAGIAFSSASFSQTASDERKNEQPLRLTLEESLHLALSYNEDIQESFRRIDAARAGVLKAEGAYDPGLFSNNRYSTFDGLNVRDYDLPNNAAKSYFRSDSGVRQRVATGGSISAYYTHARENLLGVAGGETNLERNYLTLEFAQNLLRGIGDKEQQGAIKNAMLAVQDSEENRNLVISQVVLEIVRAYWLLDYSTRNLDTANKTLAMATEVLRREHVRFKRGISQGVDVDRAETAAKQRQYTVLRYDRDVKIMRERLALLINHPQISRRAPIVPTSASSEVIPLPDELEACEAALRNRYDLKQIDILLKQLDIENEVNTNKLLPNLELVGGLTSSNGNSSLRGAENFKDTDDRRSWFVGLNFSYPLGNREARGDRWRTRELVRIAGERLHKTRRTVETQVRESLHNLTLALDGIPVARKALDSARTTLDGELARFEMGKVNNRDLLSAQDTVGQQESAYHLALAEYNIALNEFRHARASLLEYYQIVVGEGSAKMN
jgi:outer membrane protein TolC